MKLHLHQRATAAVIATTIGLSLAAQAVNTITAVHAFGDSLTDSGNLYTFTSGATPASPPNLPGRFSNGRTWVEALATDHLGLPPMSNSLIDGSNYAWGGAWTGAGGVVPSVIDQISGYTSAGGTFSSTDLVTIWGGANDFFFGPPDPTLPISNLSNALAMVAGAGAEHVLVMNLPDLGSTPDIRALGPVAAAGMTALSQGFNGLLADAVAAQRGALGIRIDLLDVFGLTQDFIANPGDYGLTNVTDGASLTGNEANAATFAYWDGVHPTETVHNIFAEKALGIIPEPSSSLLIVTSSLVLIARRRRDRAA